MSLLTTDERGFAEAISQVAYCNPFLPERIAGERAALGAAFDERFSHWNLESVVALCPNIDRMVERSEVVLAAVKARVTTPALVARREASLTLLSWADLLQRHGYRWRTAFSTR